MMIDAESIANFKCVIGRIVISQSNEWIWGGLAQGVKLSTLVFGFLCTEWIGESVKFQQENGH